MDIDVRYNNPRDVRGIVTDDIGKHHIGLMPGAPWFCAEHGQDCVATAPVRAASTAAEQACG